MWGKPAGGDHAGVVDNLMSQSKKRYTEEFWEIDNSERAEWAEGWAGVGRQTGLSWISGQLRGDDSADDYWSTDDLLYSTIDYRLLAELFFRLGIFDLVTLVGEGYRQTMLPAGIFFGTLEDFGEFAADMTDGVETELTKIETADLHISHQINSITTARDGLLIEFSLVRIMLSPTPRQLSLCSRMFPLANSTFVAQVAATS